MRQQSKQWLWVWNFLRSFPPQTLGLLHEGARLIVESEGISAEDLRLAAPCRLHILTQLITSITSLNPHICTSVCVISAAHRILLIPKDSITRG